MRKKRFLSVVLASALVATTMAVPAMASDQGTLNVTMGDKTAVLRVQVPTRLMVNVDPLEIATAGTQLDSEIFDMANLSELPVKISVNSDVTAAGVTLVAKRADVSTNATGAWMAAVAKTAADSYDDVRTVSNETIGTLSEGNSNVATVSTNGKANQVFYLDKGTGAVSYKMLSGNSDGSVKAPTYAQVYSLNQIQSISNNDDLQVSVNAGDVYTVASANVSTADLVKTAVPEKIAKGTQDPVYVSTNNYYTADTTTNAGAPAGGEVSLTTDGTLYIYGTTASEGGQAGFRYIGELSDKKASWDKTDISAIAINYNITGVKASAYEEVKEYCVYGLHGTTKANNGPKVTATSDGHITITGLTASKNIDWDKMEVVHSEGSLNLQTADNLTWDTTKWSDANGGEIGCELETPWLDWLNGQTVTVKIGLTDNTTISVQVRLQK